MNFKYKVFLLMVWSLHSGLCETEVDSNSTSSRREILEQQARTAYQNACFRLQELSNWMTAVFRIKSVWASSTVNEIVSRSEGSIRDLDRGNKLNLPSRLKTTGSECSFRSVQVTAQTYAYLQSQMVLLKWLLGRNVLRSGKEKLERMKMLETFNATLNNVLSKLRQNTEKASTLVNSESWRAGKILKDIQEGHFLQYFQGPKTFLTNMLEDQVNHNYTQGQSGSTNFFQNLGRNLDKILFPAVPVELNSTVEHITEGTPADDAQ